MDTADNLMLKFLRKFDENPFLIKTKGKEHLIGAGEPIFTVEFKKPLSLSELTNSTSLALGEAYMKGDLIIEGDLYKALDSFLGQREKFSTNTGLLKKLLFTSTRKKNQLKEVSSHYDIGNDFYKLWLDETMSYSCGYFKNENDSLYNAQINKIDYTLKKLYLKEGQTLLDIGCGWGYLLITAAKKYKIKGLGITLSKEQQKEFQKRIKEENLQNYLEVELMDYRDLQSLDRKFDRIVSIGMLEHVGRKNYDKFIKTAKKILNPGGLFLLHYISALKEFDGDPWIKKYIFPGGVIPSLREIENLFGEYNFHTLDIENLRNHYTKTLLCWNRNFHDNLNEISKKFNSEFIRMWEMYLCSCAAIFHNGVVDLHQILVTNGINNNLPITRWY
ncbi:MAG: class I SAM-dependent methyltransferase [Clostridiales bacterium]|nr:class I SAM-dependent methyltransferase [Clostridiales bacterium]